MVTTAITNSDQLSDMSRQVVALVERFGFQWEFDYDYLTPVFDRKDPQAKRVQIRDIKHLAPASKVAELRAAFERAEQLPPIVMTKDGWVIDGNTRIAGANAAKQVKMQAIVVDAIYEGGHSSDTRRIWGLSAAFNARNGRGIDRKEVANAVQELMANPEYTGVAIAELLGVTAGTVQGIMAERKARERAESLGIHVNGSLTGEKLRALGRQVEHMHGDPFKALFELASDSGMSGADITTLAKQVGKAESDTEAMGIISHEREARQRQISEYKASGKSVPPTSGKLRQRLGFILSYKDNPSDLKENNPNLVHEYISQLEESIIVLQKAIVANKEG